MNQTLEGSSKFLNKPSVHEALSNILRRGKTLAQDILKEITRSMSSMEADGDEWFNSLNNEHLSKLLIAQREFIL